jgi:methyl-accepting chemotaxis protein
VKLNNLTITPKLGILVGVTLFGLCAAGALAGYLMQQEMLNARIDQIRSIVDMARNMAVGLQKQVDAGQLTREAALAEFGRRANSMTYDNGAGYLIGTNYDGITVLSPDPKLIGTNRMDVVTNGRTLSRELMEGVKTKGVTQAASATGKAATDVLTNARELDNQSGMLRSAVDGFLAKVRAA